MFRDRIKIPPARGDTRSAEGPPPLWESEGARAGQGGEAANPRCAGAGVGGRDREGQLRGSGGGLWAAVPRERRA